LTSSYQSLSGGYDKGDRGGSVELRSDPPTFHQNEKCFGQVRNKKIHRTYGSSLSWLCNWRKKVQKVFYTTVFFYFIPDGIFSPFIGSGSYINILEWFSRTSFVDGNISVC
jgi:hypothetical protein